MNRKGLFGPLIVLILLGMLILVWTLILPSFTPILTDTINHERASSNPYSDGTEFFLRMIPWAVPLIIVLGFLWLMVKG